jgi:hypothetical protein
MKDRFSELSALHERRARLIFELEKINSEIEIQKLRLQDNQSLSQPSPKRNHLQDYIEANGINDEEDRQLILRGSMRLKEVAEEIDESISTVWRRLNEGSLKDSADSKPHRMRIDSISVYEYLQFGRRVVG